MLFVMLIVLLNTAVSHENPLDSISGPLAAYKNNIRLRIDIFSCIQRCDAYMRLYTPISDNRISMRKRIRS